MIRAAIVGVGGWGRRLVDSVQGKSERIRFTTAVARTLTNSVDYALAKGMSLTSDYAAVLADKSIDAIVLATPHTQHVEQVIQAARAGKHVYVEKPFALDKASAERAAQACRDAGIQVGFGFNRRFRSAMQALHQQVVNARLGKIIHIECDFNGPALNAPSPWRLAPAEAPGGAMTAKGIHMVDSMIWMAGPIQSVYAFCDSHDTPEARADTTSMMVRFASGASGTLSTIYVTAEYWRFHVFGTKGWGEVRSERVLTTCLLGAKPQTTEYPDNNSLGEALECFVDAIEGTGRFPVSLEDAINSSALLEGLTVSAARGVQVSLS